jgi:hypothetical protein
LEKAGKSSANLISEKKAIKQKKKIKQSSLDFVLILAKLFIKSFTEA